MGKHQCAFCGNDKFLLKTNLIIAVGEKYYETTTEEFIICSECQKKLELAKIQTEIDFVKKMKKDAMTNVLTLPDDTRFYVVNGAWNGYITSDEKGNRIIYAGVSDFSDLTKCANKLVLNKDGEYLLEINIL